MSKEKIREQIKLKRKSLDEAFALSEGQRALQIFRPWMSRQSPWLLYSPVQNEISIHPLFETLRNSGVIVGFPRVDDSSLRFHRVNEIGQLVSGRFSLEPPPTAPQISTEFGIIVVPGVSFSRDGHRLGFGQGFYDRFLNQHPHLLRLGLGYDFQILDRLPAEPHDERMDFIVTPSALWASARI